MNSEKAQIRSELKLRLKNLDDLSQRQQKIEKVLQEFMSAQVGVWGSFIAMKYEPDLSFLESNKQLKSIKWVYPIVVEEGQPLAFAADKEYVLSEISGFLVPGLGFDPKGSRLGRGKGFYDRTLALTKAIRVGVAWDCQLIESIPTEAHDLKMDWICTESGMVKV